LIVRTYILPMSVLRFGIVRFYIFDPATAQASQEVLQETVKEVNNRKIVTTLFLSNPYDGGDWGAAALCPEGSYGHAFEVLVSGECANE